MPRVMRPICEEAPELDADQRRNALNAMKWRREFLVNNRRLFTSPYARQLRDHDDIATRGLGPIYSAICALKQIFGRGSLARWVKIRADAERQADVHFVNANHLDRHHSSDAFQHLSQRSDRDRGNNNQKFLA